MKKLKTAWKLLKETYEAFAEDKVVKLSAALSYYTVFSLPSLLLVVVGLGSIFYGYEAMQGQVFSVLKNYIGADASMQLQKVLQQTTINNRSTWAAIVGGGTLLLAAAGIFGEIQDSINSIWGLKAKPKKGLVLMLVNRLLSFSMILILAFILMVSLMLNTFLNIFVTRLKAMLPDNWVDIFFFTDYIVVFVATALLFTCIFKVLPDARIRWKQALTGALLTSLLFVGGESLIGYYIGTYTSITTYGTAGSVLILLLWVYYSSLILYFGAEFTQVYSRFKGIKIEPNKYAVWVEKDQKELSGKPAVPQK